MLSSLVLLLLTFLSVAQAAPVGEVTLNKRFNAYPEDDPWYTPGPGW